MTSHTNVEKKDYFDDINRRISGFLGELPELRPIKVLDELILTVLSQNTNDKNRDRAWFSLLEKYPPEKCEKIINNEASSTEHEINWVEVSKSSEKEIQDVINVAGLAGSKAATIKRVLKKVNEDFGSLNMQNVNDWSSQRIFEYLVSIKGVGPKTANCVLCFSLGKSAFPVDTHVLRILKRLEIIPENTSLDKANRLMSSMVPENLHLPLHMNIIRLGRTICRPSKPKCSQCPLFSLPCPYGISIGE